jgi:hypothetical protein
VTGRCAVATVALVGDVPPATGRRAEYVGPNRSLRATPTLRRGGDARGMSRKRGPRGRRAVDPRPGRGDRYVRAGSRTPSPAAAGGTGAPPTPPTATATLPAAVRTDESTLTFTVTYRDEKALDRDDRRGDVVLVGRGGGGLPADAGERATPADDGRSAPATYRVASPAAVWRRKDRGTYSVRVIDGAGAGHSTGSRSSRDGRRGHGGGDAGPAAADRAEGEVLPRQAGPAGPAGLTCRPTWPARRRPRPAARPRLPTRRAAPAATAPRRRPAARPARPVGRRVAYDAERRTLTWTFPTLPPASSRPARTRCRSCRPDRASADGKPLDGNADGLAATRSDGQAAEVKR